MTDSASSRFDHNYTVTINGAWYAPTGRHESPEYLGAEFSSWKVTKKLQSANHTAQWEVTCTKCGAKKRTNSTLIKRGIAGTQKSESVRILGACKCPGLNSKIPLRADGVLDCFDLTVEQFRAVIAVIACEKMGGYSPTRIEVEKGTRSHVSTPALVRKGWIKTEGRPLRMVSTPKARRELGVTTP